VLAGTLGIGRDADVAVLVLSFPDLLTTVLVGGAISAVVIPDFKAAQAAGGSRRLFVSLSILVGAATSLVALAAAVAAPLFVRALGPGLPEGTAALAVPLFALAAVVFPLTALASVTTGYLQANGRFGIPAAGTLIFNLTLVAAVALFVRPDALVWIAAGAIVGAALRWLSQLVAALRLADPSGPLPRRARDLAGLARRYPAALGATSAIVLVPFAARTIASFGATGDVASLSYALRIVDFPLGSFITVGSVAALPHLAELVVAHRRGEASALLADLLRVTAALTVPVTVALVVVAAPIAALLYGRGAAGPAAVEQIGGLAAVALLSLPAQGANAAFTAVYVADRRLGRAFVINALGLVAFAVVALVAADRFGVRGIAAAYVALHWTLALVYDLDLRRARGLALASDALPGIVTAALVGAAVVLPFVLVLTMVALSPPLAVAVAAAGSIAGIAGALRVAYGRTPLRSWMF
jgi:putative peptidoglycan lipid II flippase